MQTGGVPGGRRGDQGLVEGSHPGRSERVWWPWCPNSVPAVHCSFCSVNVPWQILPRQRLQWFLPCLAFLRGWGRAQVVLTCRVSPDKPQRREQTSMDRTLVASMLQTIGPERVCSSGLPFASGCLIQSEECDDKKPP
jgi:hypothetical protein